METVFGFIHAFYLYYHVKIYFSACRKLVQNLFKTHFLLFITCLKHKTFEQDKKIQKSYLQF